MPGAARYGDPVSCPADVHGWSSFPVSGMLLDGSGDTFFNDMPAVRMGDGGEHAACCGPNHFLVAAGSPDWFVNDRPVARGGDPTLHCGLSPGVIIPGMTSFDIFNG